MKILTSFVAAALIVISSAQVVTAAPRHPQVKTDRVTAQQQQSRNRDAYASWPAEQLDWRDAGPTVYSGGYSAPAGR